MKDARKPRRRLMILVAGIATWSLVILGRMVQIQVYRAEDLRELAARQQSSTVELDPVRGTIYDRNGVELALSRDVQSIYAVPGLVESPERTATALARTLKLDRAEKRKLLSRLRMKDRNFIWLQRKLSDAEAAEVAKLALPGIAFLPEPKRFYPRGSLAAQTLGYVGLDNSGLAGLEQYYDADVRGIPGVKLTLRDARGVHFLPEPGGLPAEPGRNLVLTLDAGIQWVLERELEAAVEANRAKSGVAIVLDPWTGEVLALGGHPSFDPNDYAAALPAARRNPVVQEAYEPGSTFKVLTFIAALEQGLLRLDERIDCGRGGITVAGHRIGDHESFDILSPLEVIAHSSNVGAIVVGSRIAPDDLHGRLRSFGLGRPTGIDLPGESPGLLRHPRNWSGLSRAMISMGQEVGVTPLQLAVAFAAVANGGTLVRPHLVQQVVEPDGRVVRSVAPEAVRRVASERTMTQLVTMMEEVVRSGTAKAADIPGIQVAGKTGTAEKIVNGSYAVGSYIASFAGFAPSSEPRVVVLVALDEPHAGIFYGGLVAAPVVKRILEPTLAILGIASEGRTVAVRLKDYYPEAEAPAPPAGELAPGDAARESAREAASARATRAEAAARLGPRDLLLDPFAETSPAVAHR